MIETKELGALLKNRRKTLNIHQKDLSEISGVALHTVSDIESGKGNPTLTVMNKLCDVLGLELLVQVKRNN
ncbi:MAG: helix-turn-helix transcriptional regulator [Candidatus Cloacimonetes bacterium]|nr:helix-turn-helix transcriptional regulator [Candidatus Cloacimonadota bacterium]